VTKGGGGGGNACVNQAIRDIEGKRWGRHLKNRKQQGVVLDTQESRSSK